MNKEKRSIAKTGFVWGGAVAALFTGCTTYVSSPPAVSYQPPPPAVVYAPPPPTEPPVVEIQAAADFYEPLRPHGEWIQVAPYGRCWRPRGIQADWRPYSNGHWQRTDAGWYWASDEPWGWATYHYGRWDWAVNFGWIWVPQTQWAPAWVTWREGGGFVGWAPLPPSARISVGGAVEIREPAFASRAFVFVHERQLLDPVRPRTVIVNNTTIINKTVNITKINIVNKTVINEGPRPEVIERVSGRRVQPVPTRELRRREETEVVARERTIPAGMVHRDQPAAHTEPAPAMAGTPEPRRVESPAETGRQPQPPRALRERPEAVQTERQRPEAKRETAVRPSETRQVERPAVTAPRPQPPVRSREIRGADQQKGPEKVARPVIEKPVRVEPQRERARPEAPVIERGGSPQETVRGAVKPSPGAKTAPGERPAETQMKSVPEKRVPVKQGDTTRKKADEKKKGEEQDQQPLAVP